MRVGSSTRAGFLTVSLESGNMLIMTLAHARVSGDGTLIGSYVRFHPVSSAVHAPCAHAMASVVRAAQEMGRLSRQQRVSADRLAVSGVCCSGRPALTAGSNLHVGSLLTRRTRRGT